MLKLFEKIKKRNSLNKYKEHGDSNNDEDSNESEIAIVHVTRPLSTDMGYERSPERSSFTSSIRENKMNMRMMSACIREIYAPVSDLCGLQNILPDIPEGSSIYHYAKSMNTCGLLLADMIENMKCYYLLASDLYDIKLTSFALRAEIMTTWNNIMEEHNMYSTFGDDYIINMGQVECYIHFDKSVPSGIIESDSFCILKIFSSLLSNAVRFTLEGSIKVELFVSQIIAEESEEGYETFLNIIITDTGIGIADDVREAIFDPLTKAHAESIQGGVGMGLPVSRAMCRVLGGELILERSSESISKTGTKGSVFHATVPITFNIDHDMLNNSYSETVNLDYKNHKCRGTSSVSLDDETEGLSEMPRVLLVEDVKLNRVIVTKMLGDVNIVIETSENGDQAVEKCKFQTFDVILMDIVMPGMGGIQTTNKIRQVCPLNNTTPIVALTGVLSSSVKKECLKNGMVDYIQKPVVRKKLIETVALYTKTKHRRWIINNSEVN